MSTSPWSRVFATGVLLAAFVVLPADSFADNWPQQSVRILTGPLAAGSSIDATARVLAEELSKRWKQSVVVDTRPGADGIIAAKALLEARDGHTLLFTTHSIFTVVPLLREPIPYDPNRLRPLAVTATTRLRETSRPFRSVFTTSSPSPWRHRFPRTQ